MKSHDPVRFRPRERDRVYFPAILKNGQKNDCAKRVRVSERPIVSTRLVRSFK